MDDAVFREREAELARARAEGESFDAVAAELERVMKRSGLTPSSLAKRLSDRGWDVRPRDVFNWRHELLPTYRLR